MTDITGLKQIEQMQKTVNDILNPAAMQILKNQQKAIESISPQIKMMQPLLKDFSKSITPFFDNTKKIQKNIHLLMSPVYLESISASLNQVKNIFDINKYLHDINTINNILQTLNVFDAIPLLRNEMSFCFSYEHDEKEIFDKEIYPELFEEDECAIKLKETTLEVSFKVGKLEIEGQSIKDVVSLKRLFPNITKKEIYNFIRFLKKYPFMAMSGREETGLKIFNNLKEKAEEHCIVVNEGTILYRARKLDGKEAFIKDEEMLEPDTGIPNIGRYNPYGVALLYASEDIETSKMELECDDVQIAKILVNKPLKCIDLEKSGGLLYDFCKKSLSADNNEWNPSEYVLPNFLGQCGYYLKCEYGINLDGFKYKSTKNKEKYCYVFFEVHQPDIKIVDICCNL